MMQPAATSAKASSSCVWRQPAGMHTHTGITLVTAFWPWRIAAAAAATVQIYVGWDIFQNA